MALPASASTCHKTRFRIQITPTHGEPLKFGQALTASSQSGTDLTDLGEGGGERGLAVVDVADGADVDVGLPATQIQPRDHSNSGVADLGRKGREGGAHVRVKVAMDLARRPADGGGGWPLGLGFGAGWARRLGGGGL